MYWALNFIIENWKYQVVLFHIFTWMIQGIVKFAHVELVPVVGLYCYRVASNQFNNVMKKAIIGIVFQNSSLFSYSEVLWINLSYVVHCRNCNSTNAEKCSRGYACDQILEKYFQKRLEHTHRHWETWQILANRYIQCFNKYMNLWTDDSVNEKYLKQLNVFFISR